MRLIEINRIHKANTKHVALAFTDENDWEIDGTSNPMIRAQLKIPSLLFHDIGGFKL